MKSNIFTNNLHIVVIWIFEVGDRVREIDYGKELDLFALILTMGTLVSFFINFIFNINISKCALTLCLIIYCIRMLYKFGFLDGFAIILKFFWIALMVFCISTI